MSTIRETAKEIVAKAIGVEVDHLTLDSDIHNTEGWDSMNFMNIVNDLEVKFAITFGAGEIAQMFSVQNIVDLVEKKT